MSKQPAKVPDKEKVTVDAESKSVVIDHLTLTHPLAFEYLSSVKADDRADAVRKAIGIGSLALIEDRLSAFLARTEDELGVQLESLKLLYKNREILAGTTRKGTEAEVEYSDVLRDIIRAEKLADTVALTGATAEDELNKTGDILVTVNDSRLPSPRLIAIESKLVAGMTLGTIAKRAVVADGDTVLSQLLEMRSNRKSDEQIIVLDDATAKDAIKSEVGSLRYFEERGFVVITDRARYNFEPLRIAYLLARRMVIERAQAEKDGKTLTVRLDAVNLVVEKFLRNLDLLERVKDTLLSIRKQTFAGVKDLEQMQLAVERDREAVGKLLGNGGMTSEELFDCLEHAALGKEWAAKESSQSLAVDEVARSA